MRIASLFEILDPRRSLRSRLVLITVGFVFLLSTSLSLIVGSIATTQLQAAAHQSLEELAFQMADKLDRGMFERYRDLQILSSLDALRQPDESITAKRTLLERLQETYPNYAWLGMTDRDGTVLASTGGLLEGKNASKRQWFQSGLSQPYVGDVHEALLLAKLLPNPTGEPLRFVDVATPIYSQQRQLQGVLSAHLSWSWAQETTQQLLTPQSKHNQVEILVLSQDGTVLLGPPTLQGEQLSLPNRKKVSQSDKPISFMESWPNQGKFLTGMSMTQGYLSYPGLGWSVVVRQPASIALASARLLQSRVLGWGLGLGTLFALLSWLSTRRISLSMGRLTAAADQIQQGYTTTTIPTIQGRDELAKLAHSLSYMVQTLRNQRQDLQSTNEQLQSELIEREQAEQKIREQAALLNIATDAIFVRDLEHQILFWNEGAERIYGWSEEEALGQNAHTLLNAEPSSPLDLAWDTVMTQGDWRGELEKITQAGHTITVESRWTLAKDETHHPKFILTVDTDITDQKELEAKFLRAQRLESLGTLASGIAHDLNNIFTPIMGAAKLLPHLLDAQDEKSQSLVKILDKSAIRGRDLVTQILAFARGEDGQFVALQVGHVLTEIQQIIHSTFPKSIQLQTHIPTRALPAIVADATQLHQVLMNLCVNARDAMQGGGILGLSAEIVSVDQAFAQMYLDASLGEYIVISIADTGMGMSSEVQERIFDPFFTTKDIGKGTGLGLSTVRGIVQKHGGFLNVYSEVGRGTTIKVFMPIESSEAEPQPTIDQPLRPGEGELILVVDDEVLIRQVTQKGLEFQNYSVITASNGQEAIAQYQRYQAHIKAVLIDMMMPELGGQEAIAALRAINPDLKIIATSGLALDQSIGLNVNRFLSKPYTLQDLLQAIQNVL